MGILYSRNLISNMCNLYEYDRLYGLYTTYFRAVCFLTAWGSSKINCARFTSKVKLVQFNLREPKVQLDGSQFGTGREPVSSWLGACLQLDGLQFASGRRVREPQFGSAWELAGHCVGPCAAAQFSPVVGPAYMRDRQ